MERPLSSHLANQEPAEKVKRTKLSILDKHNCSKVRKKLKNVQEPAPVSDSKPGSISQGVATLSVFETGAFFFLLVAFPFLD